MIYVTTIKSLKMAKHKMETQKNKKQEKVASVVMAQIKREVMKGGNK